MSWLYVPGTEASDSDSSSPGWNTEPYVTLSGTATQRPFSWRGWKIRPWIGLLSGMTLSPSTVERGLERWILSRLGSHASRGPLPGRKPELTIIAGSGRTSPGSWVRFDRGSCSWRTSRDSTGEPTGGDLPTFSRILPTSGSMRNGVCSPQPTLEPPSDESAYGFSLWPTATSTDFKQSGGKFAGEPSDTNSHGMTLTDRAVRLWGTPVARDDQKSPEAHLAMKERMGGGRKEATSLTVQVKMWENPKARDYKNSDTQGNRNSPDLPYQATQMWPTPRASEGTRGSDGPHGDGGLSLKATVSHQDPTMRGDGNGGSPQADLNPAFVEALMGLPAGWSNPKVSPTSSTCSATDSFRRWLRRHSLNYRGGS